MAVSLGQLRQKCTFFRPDIPGGCFALFFLLARAYGNAAYDAGH
jgi:hypothetical protein